MPVVDLQLNDYSFDVDNFIPLDNTALFPQPFHAVVDIYHEFHSTYWGSQDITMRLYVEFDIYGCTASAETFGYPHASVFLAENDGQRGMGFDATGYDVRNVTGFFQEQNNQIPITQSGYTYSASMAYASNCVTRVEQCNIPLVLDYQGDLYPDKLFWTTNDASELNLYNYNPYTAQVTKEILKHAINYGEVTPVIPEGEDFEFTVMWTTGIWNTPTQPQVTQVYYQGVRGKITSGKFALYKIDGIDDNKLKYGIKSNATFYGLETTSNGSTWTSVDEFPYTFLYRPHENELSDNIIGYALTTNGLTSYFSVWEDEEDAQDYIDGDKLIEQAPNFNEIANHYPINNLTEDEDTSTTMGEVYTRAFFSQQYLLTATGVQEISNALFDTDSGGITGIVDDIIKGLRMYGNDITQAVQGLMFYPFSLDTVFTDTESINHIYFGGYRFPMTSDVKRIVHPNGHIDFGSFDLRATFGDKNFRNYAPYSRLFCYLAYIGWVELDIARYIGSTVNIKYYIDTRTGMCMACLFKGSILVDYFQGQMGVSMPISLTDYSRYAQAQIQTLLGGANSLGNTGQQVSGMAFDLAKQGAVDVASIGVAGVGLGAVGVGIGATKTLYGLTQNNINNFNKTKGGSSSMLNQYLPQECMFMFEIQDVDETPNHRALYGYPSNASGQLQNFSGYLEVDTVNLICSDATANEKAEIVRQLQSGVYI